MADRGRRLDAPTQQHIQRQGKYTPIKQLARQVGVSRNTVRKYLRAVA